MGTIFLSQRTKNGLFEFMALSLCFQKSNAWFENVGMFEFWSKSLNCIEKARIDEKKFESWREIHPRDWQICSTYGDVRVFKYSSYRYFFAWIGLVGSRDRQICSTTCTCSWIDYCFAFNYECCRDCSSKLWPCVCNNDASIPLAEQIWRSHIPPMWLASGGFLFYLIQFAFFSMKFYLQVKYGLLSIKIHQFYVKWKTTMSFPFQSMQKKCCKWINWWTESGGRTVIHCHKVIQPWARTLNHELRN